MAVAFTCGSEGVKKHDIHIKIKSYEFELLGELVI